MRFCTPAVTAAFAFAALPASAAEMVREADFTQFEFCYGNLEGSQALLPKLKPDFDPAAYEQVEKATGDFVETFLDLEMRLTAAVFHADKADLNAAHIRGYQAWIRPENQTLEYWSRNGPMPVACFDLYKRLNEILPLRLP